MEMSLWRICTWKEERRWSRFKGTNKVRVMNKMKRRRSQRGKVRRRKYWTRRMHLKEKKKKRSQNKRKRRKL